jgi:hypothetical protein
MQRSGAWPRGGCARGREWVLQVWCGWVAGRPPHAAELLPECELKAKLLERGQGAAKTVS